MGANNRRCPKCQEAGRDTGSDSGHLWLMEDGSTWCCLKDTYHKNGKPYYEKVDGGEEEEMDEEDPVEDVLAMLSMPPKVKPLIDIGDSELELNGYKGSLEIVETRDDMTEGFRGIPPQTMNQYEVFGTYDKGGKLTRLSHPIYEVGGDELCIKYRQLPKSFKTYGTSTKGRKVELYGQRGARSSRTLVITEGELDAMSLEYILSLSKYAKPAVVSLPFGANVKAITDNAKFISKYDKLIICPDGDEAGSKFAKEVASLYPQALFMDLGEHKDVNEMLEVGKFTEVTSAYFGATHYKPPYLVDIKKLKPKLSIPIPMGYSTPWPTLDNLIYGISKGAIISIAAAPSAGKTIFVRAIQKWVMEKHKIKVGIYSLEESPEIVLRNLVAYEMGVSIGVPGVSYDAAEADRIATSLENECLIYDSSNYNGDWKQMMEGMRLFCALGMKIAIIDPVSSLVIGKSASEGNEALGVIMGDMIKLTQETGLSVILVNHLNNAKGKAHENGGRVLASEMTGSRSQYRYSSLILGLERDLLNDDEDIRDTLTVRVLKSRLDGSKSGKVCNLKYDQTLKRLLEIPLTF